MPWVACPTVRVVQGLLFLLHILVVLIPLLLSDLIKAKAKVKSFDLSVEICSVSPLLAEEVDLGLVHLVKFRLQGQKEELDSYRASSLVVSPSAFLLLELRQS